MFTFGTSVFFVRHTSSSKPLTTLPVPTDENFHCVDKYVSVRTLPLEETKTVRTQDQFRQSGTIHKYPP